MKEAVFTVAVFLVLELIVGLAGVLALAPFLTKAPKNKDLADQSETANTPFLPLIIVVGVSLLLTPMVASWITP